MNRIIYFAGGCFWGIQHLFSLVPGVSDAVAGYANSNVPSPTYKQVCTGLTGAAETVAVTYDPEEVALSQLIDLYLQAVDPTSVNRQGGDRGTQYRTGIYYTDPADSAEVSEALAGLQRTLSAPVAIEQGPLRNFYTAEEYHQDYLDKNPGGYCHVNPALFRKAAALRRFSRPDDTTLRRRLTPEQWDVTQRNGTERAFTGELTDEFRPGIYVDITTGEPLFVSTRKFHSGCGWPAFSRPISPDAIREVTDTSHGMVRTEVRAANSDAHLGHVFPDGPKASGGLRYCINSAALRFIPAADMVRQGYADYVSLLED